MKVIFVALVLLFASAAHADDAIANISVHSDNFSLSFDYDEPTNTVLPGTTTFDFSGPLQGTQFTLATAGQIFNWYDANGDNIELGLFDYAREFAQLQGIEIDQFPAVGTYPGYLVADTCSQTPDACWFSLGSGFSECIGGSVVITDPPSPTPEPTSLVLLALGVMGLFALKLKTA